MEAALRAGVAIYNAGEFHAAHDAWEAEWLGLDDGTDDERLLHGLIQFTAVVHHARERNWSGAVGLAESAGEYLADHPRMIGVLFTVTLLLLQAGTAAANMGSTNAGP